jgi:hypothetical protein
LVGDGVGVEGATRELTDGEDAVSDAAAVGADDVAAGLVFERCAYLFG